MDRPAKIADLRQELQYDLNPILIPYPLTDQYILRLDISMDYVIGMHMLNTFGNLSNKPGSFSLGKGSIHLENLVKVSIAPIFLNEVQAMIIPEIAV